MDNVYESRAIQRFLKTSDCDFSKTMIPDKNRILTTGMTGSGKTNFVYQYLRRMRDCFNHVYVFVKNRDEPIYNLMADKLKSHISFYSSLDDLPELSELRKKHDDLDRILVIIDDFMLEINKSKKLQEWCFTCRKKDITLILITQNFYSVGKLVRNQCSHLVFFRLESANDRRLLQSEVMLGREDIYKAYMQSTSKAMDVFIVDQTTRDLSKKYRHNFLNYFDFTDHDNTKQSAKNTKK